MPITKKRVRLSTKYRLFIFLKSSFSQNKHNFHLGKKAVLIMEKVLTMSGNSICETPVSESGFEIKSVCSLKLIGKFENLDVFTGKVSVE